MSDNLNQPIKGMNLDAHPASLPENSYTYALNARQESEDGQQWFLSNEPSNTWAIANLPQGYQIIGTLNIVELGRTIYWLANGLGGSEIGYVSNNPNGCIDTLNLINPPDTGAPVYNEPSDLSTSACMVYVIIINDNCLNFSLDHPIHDARFKTTNKTTEIYWTDNFNPPRWMDINNPPLISGSLDCNLLSIFPDHLVPDIVVKEVQNTGALKVGSYQFLVAYSNSVGKPLSQYYSVSNPTPIWENKLSETLSFDTSKAVKIAISNLDTQFTYINIAVIKTINFTETFEMAVTLSITSDSQDYVYTGNDKTAEPLTREEVYFRSPYYKTAGTLETQNKELFLGNLVTEQRVNYQSVASAIDVMWETWRIPYNKFEAYNNGANGSNLRGYMRDEVYPFDMVVIEKNGRVSDRFPLVGRPAVASDLDIIINEDALNTEFNPCDATIPRKRWEVYNTATKEAFVGTLGDPCYIGPWENGKMAYWESIRKYENNPVIWGPLADTPIRHFKFPDSIITHIHDNNPSNDIGFEHAIYPIGIKFDASNILTAIANSNLTQEQKDNIAAIRILRGNRRNDKQIEAKGIIFNVGSYNFQGQEFLYPNYPLNDTHPDVFISNESLDPITGLYTSAAAPYSGLAIGSRLNGFTGQDKSRYSFISPDTSFIHPSLSGQLKLETVEFGKANAHIVQVQNNPRYEIGTRKGVKMAVVLALTTILSYKVDFQVGTINNINASVDISFANFLTAFTSAYDMISKLVPFEQYGYQYNAVGNYCQYFPVPNSGNKIRQMSSAGYIAPGVETIPGETAPINNFQRESSVYLRTSGPLPYPWDIGAPRDNSRFNFGSYLAETGITLAEGQRVSRDISIYYASIKRFMPDQYGTIHSYQALDTGSTLYLDRPFTTVFGGDTFINRFAVKRKLPFFISNTIGEHPNTDVDYSYLGNVSYPTYYMSTAPLDPRISNSTLALFDGVYTFMTSLIGILVTVATAGIVGYALVVGAMLALMGDVLSTLGIKKVNLDRFQDAGFYLKGVMYLFAYGIPYYFVESDFNCDYRQAVNGEWGNFFPNVGTDIPDHWLQEKNVTIARDNEYTYNRDLSKQNLEDFYTYLPENWDPNDSSFMHTTRVIQSEPYNIEEQQNNWLLFRANSYWDFTHNNGNLSLLRAIEQDKVMALFENNVALYNAYITLPTNIKDAVIGNGNIFANPPQEFSRTDIGYSGSQHHAFCSTPHGHFWVDARRGCIFQLSKGLEDIARDGMSNWFKENLPFKILRTFPDYPIDNSFTGAGITMVWDNRFNRLFITKRDFIPLVDLVYKDGKFYVPSNSLPVTLSSSVYVPGSITCCPEGYLAFDGGDLPCRSAVDDYYIYSDYRDCGGTYASSTSTIDESTLTEVSIYDSNYFCDASWTIAYSPLSKSWVSFYSFTPSHYIEQQEFFQTVTQGNVEATVWNHLLTNRSYQTFYNVYYPFTVESVTKAGLTSDVLNSISYKMDVYRYENTSDYRSMKDATFTEAIIYNSNDVSGKLNLVVLDKRNMGNGMSPITNIASITIPVSHLDNIYRFNKFSSVLADFNSLKPIFNYECDGITKELNSAALDYSKPSNMAKKSRLRGDYFKVRLSNTIHARYKLIYRWIVDKVEQFTR